MYLNERKQTHFVCVCVFVRSKCFVRCRSLNKLFLFVIKAYVDGNLMVKAWSTTPARVVLISAQFSFCLFYDSSQSELTSSDGAWSKFGESYSKLNVSSSSSHWIILVTMKELVSVLTQQPKKCVVM